MAENLISSASIWISANSRGSPVNIISDSRARSRMSRSTICSGYLSGSLRKISASKKAFQWNTP